MSAVYMFCEHLSITVKPQTMLKSFLQGACLCLHIYEIQTMLNRFPELISLHCIVCVCFCSFEMATAPHSPWSSYRWHAHPRRLCSPCCARVAANEVKLAKSEASTCRPSWRTLPASSPTRWCPSVTCRRVTARWATRGACSSWACSSSRSLFSLPTKSAVQARMQSEHAVRIP